MSKTTKPVKTGTPQERRHAAAKMLVERLADVRERTITKLIRNEARLIDARRALARSEKRLAQAPKSPAPRAKRPPAKPATQAPVVAPTPPRSQAPASVPADPADKGRRLRDELRGERTRKPRGRADFRPETAPSAT